MRYTFFFLLAITCLPFRLFSQAIDSTYLSHNSTVLKVAGDTLAGEFALLDSAVRNYRFFFTAEEHWKSINTDIQFTFLRYLHDRAGVRNLILEGGFSYGFLINRYLQNGDERLLRKALTNIPVCPDNMERMFRNLRKYNQRLPEEDRISVWGIDLEHSAELSLQALNSILPSEKADKSIAWHATTLKTLHQSPEYDKGQVKRFFQKLEKDIEKQPEQYLEFWGDDFDLLCLITQNATHAFKFSLLKTIINPDNWKYREERMYANFIALQKRFKPGNYYAQFGALHTDIHRSVQWQFPTLAHRLNHFESSPVANQVLTISRFVETMREDYKRLGNYEPFMEAVDAIKDQMDGEVGLLRLIGPDTPFPQLSKNFQFILVLDDDLKLEGCD